MFRFPGESRFQLHFWAVAASKWWCPGWLVGREEVQSFVRREEMNGNGRSPYEISIFRAFQTEYSIVSMNAT